MITRIDHVAIAVKDYEKAYHFFTEILGAIPGSYSDDTSMKYLWQNISIGDLSRMELLTPTSKGSFLDNFLKNKDGGVHHITLQTPDIYKAKEELEKNNIPFFNFNDYGSAWKELFIHPKDAFGVLIQIAEFRPDDWIASSMKMPEGKKFIVEKNNEGYNLMIKNPGGGILKINLDKDEINELIRILDNIK